MIRKMLLLLALVTFSAVAFGEGPMPTCPIDVDWPLCVPVHYGSPMPTCPPGGEGGECIPG